MYIDCIAMAALILVVFNSTHRNLECSGSKYGTKLPELLSASNLRPAIVANDEKAVSQMLVPNSSFFVSWPMDAARTKKSAGSN